MTEDDRERHHRRSVRLKDYDYAQPGAYFVTVCTQERACLFGDVVNGEMRLNDVGEAVREEWFNTATIRPYVRLYDDECVVMPNHLHGIVWIVDNAADISNGRGVWPYAQEGVAGIANDDAIIANVAGVWPYATQDIARIVADVGATGRSPLRPLASPNGPKHGSIGAIMAGFKSVTAKRINQMRGTPGTKVWQRNYHEHVIRDEAALNAIRQYIAGNPARWVEDPENPAGIADGEPVRAIGRSTNARMTVDARAISRSPLPDNTDVNGGMA